MGVSWLRTSGHEENHHRRLFAYALHYCLRILASGDGVSRCNIKEPTMKSAVKRLARATTCLSALLAMAVLRTRYGGGSRRCRVARSRERRVGFAQHRGQRLDAVWQRARSASTCGSRKTATCGSTSPGPTPGASAANCSSWGGCVSSSRPIRLRRASLSARHFASATAARRSPPVRSNFGCSSTPNCR